MPKKRKRYGSYTWTDPKTGHLYARVRVQLPDGTTKPIYRRAENVTHAGQIAQDILQEYEERGKAYIDGRTMTFSDLAEWYKSEYVIEPLYSADQKVAGLRTWKAERAKIDRICESLGSLLVEEIDEDDLRRYKLRRLKADKVSITAVNRDLETIRRMLRKAIAKKWRRNVLDFSELIQKALERPRSVTITGDEFNAIAAKAREQSAEMYALVCTLYDSGARPSEIYPASDYGADYAADKATNYRPLKWRDIFDEYGNIRPVTQVTSMKGKRIETRLLVITDRMADALRSYWTSLPHPDLDALIFPHKTYKKPWHEIRKDLMPQLRLRDLRRDWVTRITKKGFSDRLGQKGAGHKRMQQTFDYTEFDMEAALQLKSLLDEEPTT